MGKGFGAMQFPGVLLIVFLVFAAVQSGGQNLCSTGVCVTTWQNDTYRTGDNLSERRRHPLPRLGVLIAYSGESSRIMS
jgi:hypothetical protein